MGFKALIRVLLILVLLMMQAAAHCESQPDFDVRLGGERSAWPQALPKLQLRVADLRGWTPSAISDCVAVFKERRYRCSLGKEGVASDKVEGDKKTPVGTFRLLSVLYRGAAPRTGGLRVDALQPDWGWCEDYQRFPAVYNHIVRMPHPCVRVGMWRPDELYHLIVVVDYNFPKIFTQDQAPGGQPVPGRGSGIFVHLSTKNAAGAYDYTGTAGCVSLSKPDLIEILSGLGPNARIQVAPNRVVTFLP